MPTTPLFGVTAAGARALLQEPLLHFLLFGGLVFAVDHWMAARSDDPHRIVVTPAVEEHARSIFRSAQGREPTPDEQKILREHWIDTEVLYREGLALKLEQGDATLRDRVVFKTMNIIESNLQVPEPDEQTLRSWFEDQRARYDEPARFDFSEAVPVEPLTDRSGRAFVAALNGGKNAGVPSDLRIFEKRPRPSIVDSFGVGFVEALERITPHEWQLLESVAGLRVVRLESRQEGSKVRFEEVRGRVRSDWIEAKAHELRAAAVRELGKKYTVELAEGSS